MSDFAFSHVLWNQNFEVVSSSHSYHIHSESKLPWKCMCWHYFYTSFWKWNLSFGYKFCHVTVHLVASDSQNFSGLSESTFSENGRRWLLMWNAFHTTFMKENYTFIKRAFHIYGKAFKKSYEGMHFLHFLDSLDNEWT